MRFRIKFRLMQHIVGLPLLALLAFAAAGREGMAQVAVATGSAPTSTGLIDTYNRPFSPDPPNPSLCATAFTIQACLSDAKQQLSVNMTASTTKPGYLVDLANPSFTYSSNIYKIESKFQFSNPGDVLTAGPTESQIISNNVLPASSGFTVAMVYYLQPSSTKTDNAMISLVANTG